MGIEKRSNQFAFRILASGRVSRCVTHPPPHDTRKCARPRFAFRACAMTPYALNTQQGGVDLRAVFVVSGGAIASILLHVGVAAAQTYPTRVVSLITSQAGGALDFTARSIAPGLTAALGQQVVVDNRAGLVMGGLVAKATPDGHTLLVQSNALWILARMQKTLYDPVKDFVPVKVMTRVSFAMPGIVAPA